MMPHSIDFLPTPKEHKTDSFLSAHKDQTTQSSDQSDSGFAVALAHFFNLPVPTADKKSLLAGSNVLPSTLRQHSALDASRFVLNNADLTSDTDRTSKTELFDSKFQQATAKKSAELTRFSIQQQTQWSAGQNLTQKVNPNVEADLLSRQSVQNQQAQNLTVQSQNTLELDVKQHSADNSVRRMQIRPANLNSNAGRSTAAEMQKKSANQFKPSTEQLIQRTEGKEQELSFISRANSLNAGNTSAQTNVTTGAEQNNSFAASLAPVTTGTSNSQTLGAAQPMPMAENAFELDLQNAQWAKQLGKNLLRIAPQGATGQSIAQIRLDPPHLGPLQVSLHIQEGQISAQFFSPHAFVRQSIEQALPQLFEQFNQAGLELGHTFVGEEQSEQHPFFAQAKAQKGTNKAAADAQVDVTEADSTSSPSPYPLRNSHSTINTFA